MHGNIKNEIGEKFGKLTVIEMAEMRIRGAVAWLCVCDCGNKINVVGVDLRRSNTRSCGCLIGTGGGKIKHGMSGTPQYNAWRAMINRCNNKSDKDYGAYGGRGIKVCKRWEKFENFYKDMGQRPDGMSLDRIDNNAGYCKENCRWTDWSTQMGNKRSNKILHLDKVSMPLAKWSRVTGIHHNTIRERLERGWSTRDALTKAVKN